MNDKKKKKKNSDIDDMPQIMKDLINIAEFSEDGGEIDWDDANRHIREQRDKEIQQLRNNLHAIANTYLLERINGLFIDSVKECLTDDEKELFNEYPYLALKTAYIRIDKDLNYLIKEKYR